MQVFFTIRAFLIKLDGYPAIGFKTDGKVRLRSWNDDDFAARYPSIAAALSGLPDETVVDGEIVAFDEHGKPSFNMLQNYGSSDVPLYFYIFDVLILSDVDVVKRPLSETREILQQKVLIKLTDPVRYSPQLEGSLSELIHSIKQSGLEGLVAKNLNSVYEAGRRSGAWRKMRVNQGPEFVIGGYTVGGKNL